MTEGEQDKGEDSFHSEASSRWKFGPTYKVTKSDAHWELSPKQRTKSPQHFRRGGINGWFTVQNRETNCLLYCWIRYSVSLDQVELLMNWKGAIHKTGLRQLPSNYKLISLTSVLVKILDRIIKKSWMIFLETNNLLNSEHYGFRKRLSCTINRHI